jgi:hypothetical protein
MYRSPLTNAIHDGSSGEATVVRAAWLGLDDEASANREAGGGAVRFMLAPTATPATTNSKQVAAKSRLRRSPP